MTLPLWLLSGLGWLRKAAGALLRLVVRYPWQAACIALLCACVWLWHGWDGANADLQACQDGRRADHTSYVEAQKAALAKARAAKAKAEQDYRNLAEKTDANERQARKDAMADAERYIAAHRVRPQAAGGASGGPSAPAEDHGPQGGNGPGAPPELVEVTPDDVRICTENTSRLDAVRDWALGLEAWPR